MLTVMLTLSKSDSSGASQNQMAQDTVPATVKSTISKEGRVPEPEDASCHLIYDVFISELKMHYRYHNDLK